MFERCVRYYILKYTYALSSACASIQWPTYHHSEIEIYVFQGIDWYGSKWAYLFTSWEIVWLCGKWTERGSMSNLTAAWDSGIKADYSNTCDTPCTFLFQRRDIHFMVDMSQFAIKADSITLLTPFFSRGTWYTVSTKDFRSYYT